MTVTNAWPGPVEGEVGLDLPSGWTLQPSRHPVRFSREDETQTVRFTVTPTDGANGEHPISAFATSGGARYDVGYQSVEYPHIAFPVGDGTPSADRRRTICRIDVPSVTVSLKTRRTIAASGS